MTTHPRTVPQLSQGSLQNLGDILELLKQHGLTVMPIQTPRADTTLSIHDIVPDVRPFSGSYERDGVTIDEWRIQMRMRLKQISLMQGPQVDEEFKANYILSMLSGAAFRWIKGEFIHEYRGGDPCAGYNDAPAVLEAVCDKIRDQLEGKFSGKTGLGI